MTAREVLDGIKAQLGAATPGPWAHYGDLGHEIYPIHGEEPEMVAGVVPRIADATFIASAPSTVARLTAAVEDVLAECDHTDTETDEALQWDLVNRIQTAIEKALTKESQ